MNLFRPFLAVCWRSASLFFIYLPVRALPIQSREYTKTPNHQKRCASPIVSAGQDKVTEPRRRRLPAAETKKGEYRRANCTARAGIDTLRRCEKGLSGANYRSCGADGIMPRWAPAPLLCYRRLITALISASPRWRNTANACANSGQTSPFPCLFGFFPGKRLT